MTTLWAYLIVSELLLPEHGVALVHLEHPHHHKEEVDARRLVAGALLRGRVGKEGRGREGGGERGEGREGTQGRRSRFRIPRIRPLAVACHLSLIFCSHGEKNKVP